MKIAKIILLAMVVALVSASMGMAAGSVPMNQSVDVSANVKNTTSKDMRVAVKLLSYDDAGNAVGHVCSEVTLRANSTKTVTSRWQAPSYKTGLYWTSKLDINGSCTNTSYDGDDSDDSDDSDDDYYHNVIDDSDDAGLEEH